MSDRIDLTSELAPSVILGKLVSEAGWRDSAGNPVFPYDPGSHKVIVRVRRNRFKIAISGKMLEKVGGVMGKNSFAPVCVGQIEELSTGGSRVRAKFRLHWFARLFSTLWFGVMASMVLTDVSNRYRHSTGFYSPPVEAVWYGIGVVLLCSPLIGVMIAFIVMGSRSGHQRDTARAIVTRASRSSSATDALPS